MTLGIMTLDIECCYAECYDLLIIMLNVVRLSVVLLNVVVPVVREGLFFNLLLFARTSDLTLYQPHQLPSRGGGGPILSNFLCLKFTIFCHKLQCSSLVRLARDKHYLIMKSHQLLPY
jgi:hypothetical protein